jgi:hypothetical protein
MQYAEDMALNSNHIGNIKTNKRFPIIPNTAQAFMCMKAHKRHFFCTSEPHRDARVGVRLWRVRARVRPRRLHPF